MANLLPSNANKKDENWKVFAQKALYGVFCDTVQTESISHKFETESVAAVVNQAIMVALCGVERRVQDIARAAVHLEEHGSGLRVERLERELTNIETFTRRYSDEKLSSFKSGKTFEPSDLNKGCNALHGRALTKCFSRLVRDMRVSETPLLDDLVACDIISVASASSIQAKATQRERNEAVLQAARGLCHERFVSAFLPALQKERGNAILAREVFSAMERLQEEEESTADGPGCQVCDLRDRVDLRRVADRLLTESLITQAEYNEIRERRIPTRDVWSVVHSRDRKKRLTRVLRDKYPDVHEEMNQLDISDLTCMCQQLNLRAKYQDNGSDVGRLSDFSTQPSLLHRGTTDKTAEQVRDTSTSSHDSDGVSDVSIVCVGSEEIAQANKDMSQYRQEQLLVHGPLRTYLPALPGHSSCVTNLIEALEPNEQAQTQPPNQSGATPSKPVCITDTGLHIYKLYDE